MKFKYIVFFIAIVLAQVVQAYDLNKWHHYFHENNTKLVRTTLDFKVSDHSSSGSYWTKYLPREFWVNIVTPGLGHSKKLEVQITYYSSFAPDGSSDSIVLEHALNSSGVPNRHTGKFSSSNVLPYLADYHNVRHEWVPFSQKIEIYIVEYKNGEWHRKELIDEFGVKLIDFVN